MQTEHPLARHICARTAHHRTQCTRTVTHHANTHGSGAHSPGLRIVVSLKGSVIPASCLICCRTCHRTLLHDLSHLPQPFSDLLPHCPVLRNWIKKPCEIHSGEATILNLHLPQVMSPKWSNPTTLRLEEVSWTEILGKIYSLEELSLTGILGQTVSNTGKNSGR